MVELGSDKQRKGWAGFGRATAKNALKATLRRAKARSGTEKLSEAMVWRGIEPQRNRIDLIGSAKVKNGRELFIEAMAKRRDHAHGTATARRSG